MILPEIAVYYDTTRGRVSPLTAQTLVDDAREPFHWISKHILLDPVPLDTLPDVDTLDPKELNIPGSRSLLLTSLHLTEGETYGTCVQTGGTTFSAIVRLPPKLAPRSSFALRNNAKLDMVVRNITHELAHGYYDIGHCAISRCVMFHYGSDKPFNPKQPFCDEHLLSLR